MFSKFVLVFFALCFSGCSDNTQIQPGMIFISTPNNITCPTKELIYQAVVFANGKQNDAFNNLLLKNGGQCMTFEYTVPVRILEVDGDVIGYRLESVPNAEAMYALKPFFTPVSSTPSPPNQNGDQ